VLIGHTHYAGVWERDGRIVVNTGSFLPFSGRSMVRLTTDRLEVRKIVTDGKEWQPGPAQFAQPIPTAS
jgi:predicted phosphodiesterase